MVACCAEPSDISFISEFALLKRSITLSIVCAVESAIAVPFETASIVLPISSLVVCAASADLLARFLTSSATTANPLPASPALAASTAALRASIFVWNAMLSIVLIIFSISADFSSIIFIAASIFCVAFLKVSGCRI